ncbi:PepSY domain-containing protein [Ponticoccus sp. SC2-23]|uniref:PepSY domain-containing protein n=1 Tax=Alexandriicola marinus TaxID=2081710 RepID=UPI000FDA08C1|nr:PepSY domain-containing protein [Alexandriicola marinus]MBM1222247.1 PepSY domain-containing protein [Ponticoccus sp. SC6-9]MBM1226934.1 PepSY domain-containing protein [Ponticoccus sp. SC6-15]MBM1231194.1 PepSY domain-containing protein [Ponticoccus sp. SC6-38]MBM1235554.1 PepSY domain-containing protein [Ponticoccus sp. SC6-45]MBM1240216.1 PepSY domain-containing protein [Ponticoccus sp. SC6-49]MBM1244570.1 PepSY domain-containing protein [Ponticoccus sp. SC2-64]MBM1249028.1 PepSY domai
MKLKLLTTTAAIAIAASVAFAQSSTDQIVSQLQAQGFTRIEIKEGPTQIKVEAIRGTTKVEYVYDNSTGELIKSEVERVSSDDDTSPGIQIRTESDDFVDDDDDDGFDDSDDDNDDDDDRGGRDDDDDDDRNDRDDDDDDGDRGGRDDNDDDNDDDDDDDRGGRDDNDDDDDRDDRDDDDDDD